MNIKTTKDQQFYLNKVYHYFHFKFYIIIVFLMQNGGNFVSIRNLKKINFGVSKNKIFT